MKVILPVAGNGIRLRPYTETRPKCLLPLAGKTIIDWIVEDALKLSPSETIFITGYKSEKMDEYLKDKSSWGKTRTVLQSNPQGLGEAVSLALPYVDDDEPILIILGDTLFKADLSILKEAKENVLYTYKVEDYKRFGVAVTDSSGRITQLVEKPQEFVSDEALVGIYYIKDTKALKNALKNLMENDRRSRGEFQLTDALEEMIQAGHQFKTAPVSQWLDCGLVETLLETNAIVMPENDNSAEMQKMYPNAEIVAPCFIGENITLDACKIGPNVHVGNNAVLINCRIEDAIIWDDFRVDSGWIRHTILHK